MSPDEKIISEIKKQNRDAFKELFIHFYADLTRYAEGFIFGRVECEDIVQNLFAYIWENADRINIQTSLESYLFRSVRNRCFNFLRDMRLTDRHKILYFETMLTVDRIDRMEDDEVNLEKYIQFALKRLPQKMAKIFELKYLKGKKLQEIAERMNISENTVKTQLHRARSKLREVMSRASSLDMLL